jgi:nucleotide-binding universal stress UspA family protein
MTAPQCLLPDHTLPREEHHAALAAGSPQSSWPRRILVAIDGSAETDPAIRAARFFTRHTDCAVDVAAIFAPRIPVPALSNRRGIDACEHSDRRDAAHLISTIRARCQDLVPDRADRAAWKFHLEVGDPGTTLVHLAAEIQADLVIVGIAQREPLDVRSGGRTTVCAARYLTAPLFAAAVDDETPSRVVVALPNGKLHAPTLRAALASVSRPAKLWLAFPERQPALAPDLNDSDAIAAALRALLGAEIGTALDDLCVERIEVAGDMLDGVLRLADELYAQLIAIPNHGDPGPVRTFLPNLAEPLLVGARCSVLVVPDSEHHDHAMSP